MLREQMSGDVPGAEKLRDMATRELRDTMGAEVEIEHVALGNGAMWVAEIGQLTLWHRGGRVMMILSPTPKDSRAIAEVVAQDIIAAFP